MEKALASTAEFIRDGHMSQLTRAVVKQDLLAFRPLILALYPLVRTHTAPTHAPRQRNDAAVRVYVCVCVCRGAGERGPRCCRCWQTKCGKSLRW